MNTKHHVVSFSGGQTSGYMLRTLIDQNPDFRERFTVLFCNTGKEHDATLDFVHRVETEWNIPIVWLEYTRVPASEIPLESMPEGRKRQNLQRQQEAGEMAHWFKVVNYHTASREHDRGPFDELLDWAAVLPNVRTRSCSVQMKIRTMNRYLNHVGVMDWIDYIGIRADEAHRKTEILLNSPTYQQPIFPLVDAKVTRQQVDEWWDAQPFKLEIPNYDGNCRLCFLKANWKRAKIARENPESLEWWLNAESRFAKKTSGDGNVFRKGQSYKRIQDMARQQVWDFDESEDDIPCSCSVGGYRKATEDED